MYSPAPPISSTYPTRLQSEVIAMPSPCDNKLFEACKYGSIDKAKAAIEEGADLEALEPKSKSSPLTIVRMQRIKAVDSEKEASKDPLVSATKRMISAYAPSGAYTELEQFILDRILLKAAETGDISKMEWALDEGADKDAVEPDFKASAAVVAASLGFFDAVAVLRERGADMEKRDVFGMAVQDWKAINMAPDSKGT